MADETIIPNPMATGGDPVETNAVPSVVTEEQPDSSKPGVEPKFTQADVNAIMAKVRNEEQAKLKRDQEKAQAETEAKRLQEQGEFQKLYEAAQATVAEKDARIAELEQSIAQKERDALCARVGAEYKLPPNLISRLKGETEEEIKADAEALQKDIAPPAAPLLDMGNGNGRFKPSPEEAVKRLQATGDYNPF